MEKSSVPNTTSDRPEPHPIRDGGPAFPNTEVWDENVCTWAGTPGLSLRDYFAAKAMQAMVQAYVDVHVDSDDGDQCRVVSRDLLIDTNGITGEHEGANEIATDAYIIADAMLRARKSGGAA